MDEAADPAFEGLLRDMREVERNSAPDGTQSLPAGFGENSFDALLLPDRPPTLRKAWTDNLGFDDALGAGPARERELERCGIRPETAEDEYSESCQPSGQLKLAARSKTPSLLGLELEGVPAMSPLVRSTSTPDACRVRSASTSEVFTSKGSQGAARAMKRSSSAEAFFCSDAMDTKEVHDLVQEFQYHTELSYKQLQELRERVLHAQNASASSASSSSSSGGQTAPLQQTPSSSSRSTLLPTTILEESPNHPEVTGVGADSIEAVLAEFNLAFDDPSVLRQQLRSRLSKYDDRASADSSPVSDGAHRATSSRSLSFPAAPPSSSLEAKRSTRGLSANAAHSRTTVRLQINHFLEAPLNRPQVLLIWRHDAESLPAVQQHGSWLPRGKGGEKWYKRLYTAFQTMFSNLLDDNDSPIREVLFDLVSHEASKATWRAPKDDKTARPPRLEGTRRAGQCFANAVLAVRSREAQKASEREWHRRAERSQPQGSYSLPEIEEAGELRIRGQQAPAGGEGEGGSVSESLSFEKCQWADSLSRVNSQFERALEET